MESGSPTMGALIAGRYEVDSLIAAGGFGRVFLAHHVHLRSRVAVKLLRPAHAETAEVRRRFLREARVLADMFHPHIVRTTDLGEMDDGTLYLVMEYIDGLPLSALIARRDLPPERGLHLLSHAASALDFAHRRGIVHRDLKPANIMITSLDGDDDYAKLIDFGILKRYESSESSDPYDTEQYTGTHVLVGTPSYMAPEQIRRQPVGPATDQYALAIVAYETLTGRRPFAGGSPIEVMSRRLSQPPPLLGALMDGTIAPNSADEVLGRALALDPADRWPSVGAFVAALQKAFAADPSRAPASPEAARARGTGGSTPRFENAPSDAPTRLTEPTLTRSGTTDVRTDRVDSRRTKLDAPIADTHKKRLHLAIAALVAAALLGAGWWAWQGRSENAQISLDSIQPPAHHAIVATSTEPFAPTSAPPNDSPQTAQGNIGERTTEPASEVAANAFEPKSESAVVQQAAPADASMRTGSAASRRLSVPAPNTDRAELERADFALRRGIQEKLVESPKTTGGVALSEGTTANKVGSQPSSEPVGDQEIGAKSAAGAAPVSINKNIARLSVLVKPRGNILIDGRSYGGVGLANRSIPAGRRKVEARGEDGRSLVARVTLSPNRHYRMKFDLEGQTWTIDE